MSEVRDPEVFRAVLDTLPTGVYIADQNGTILFWNQSAERITGHKRYEVIGHSRRENILAQCDQHCCPACGDKCPFHESAIDGHERELRLCLRHKNGHPVAVVFRINPVRNQQGIVNYVVGSFEQPHATAAPRDRRTAVPTTGVDESTGVANHGFIEFQLRENLAGFAEYHVAVSVLCLQLDHFEHLRAAYGRPATDSMLRVVAETLCNSLRPSDVVGHWGQDQFLAVLPNCTALGTEKAAERVQKLVAGAGIHWWGEQLSIATSIGFASAETGDTADSLVERAQRSLKPAPAGRTAIAGAAALGVGHSSGK
jgi:two-component system, cell cycle response regulator